MKRCLSCSFDFDVSNWTCPNCGHQPSRIDGVYAFAPALAVMNDGLDPEAHHNLHVVQEKSFWFRVRNRILTDMIYRYLAHRSAVLEIGCGTGFVLSAIAKALPQAHITGSEIYANGLHYASERLHGRAELMQMDATSIPFTDEFDLIAACDVLEHIEDDVAVLSQIYRALRPGGAVMLTVPQHPFLWSGSDDAAHHKRRYRRWELAAKLRHAGFKIVRSTSFVTSLLPLLMLQRLTQGKKKDYDASAEFAMPAWLDRLLEAAMEVDRWMIGLGLSLPAGGSRLIVAVRP